MKVNIDMGDNDWYLTISPEEGDDTVNLEVFVGFLQRYKYKINVQEIGYMQPNINFVVSKI